MYKALTDTDVTYQEFVDNEDMLSIVSAAGTVFLLSGMTVDSPSGGVVEEVDPTVSDWAKQPEKPTYTYAEIKDKPALLSLGEKSGTAYDGAKGKQNATDIAALKTSVAGKQDALVFDIAYNANTNKVATVFTVIDKIFAHNVNDAAHNDIRLLIASISDRLNAVLNSDDTTLDQLKEIADYIKANRGLIDGVTTSKVNYADIVDNLTTNLSGKVLSAAQGVVLKSLIDALANDKLDENDLGTAINTALRQAKESGEFDGKDGYTPVKGTDYFTESDKNELVTAVISALPIYDGSVTDV